MGRFVIKPKTADFTERIIIFAHFNADFRYDHIHNLRFFAVQLIINNRKSHDGQGKGPGTKIKTDRGGNQDNNQRHDFPDRPAAMFKVFRCPPGDYGLIESVVIVFDFFIFDFFVHANLGDKS